MNLGNARKYKNKKAGFGLVEIVVGVGIITLVSFGLAQASIISLKAVRRSGDAVQAAFLIEEGMEAIKYLRDSAWANIVTGLSDSEEHCLDFNTNIFVTSAQPPSCNLIGGKFTRTVIFNNVCRDGTSNDILRPTTGPADDCAPDTLDNGTRQAHITVTWDSGSKSREADFYIANIYSEQ